MGTRTSASGSPSAPGAAQGFGSGGGASPGPRGPWPHGLCPRPPSPSPRHPRPVPPRPPRLRPTPALGHAISNPLEVPGTGAWPGLGETRREGHLSRGAASRGCSRRGARLAPARSCADAAGGRAASRQPGSAAGERDTGADTTLPRPARPCARRAPSFQLPAPSCGRAGSARLRSARRGRTPLSSPRRPPRAPPPRRAAPNAASAAGRAERGRDLGAGGAGAGLGLGRPAGGGRREGDRGAGPAAQRSLPSPRRSRPASACPRSGAVGAPGGPGRTGDPERASSQSGTGPGHRRAPGRGTRDSRSPPDAPSKSVACGRRGRRGKEVSI